jgi:hypothetical protein
MGQLQARIETAVNKTGTYNEALQNLADAFGAPPSETGSRLIPVVKVFDPTIDNATAAQNYLLYNSTVVAGGIPAMALNFTSSESLDSRITFSRASNATVVNSDGLVAYAPHNLLTNSESFEAAAWAKLGLGSGVVPVVTSNVEVAPDGTVTADRVQLNCNGTTSSDRSIVTQSVTGTTIGATYIGSVWIKAYSVGEVGKQLRFHGDSILGGTIVTLTADWQRVSVSGVASATSGTFGLEVRGTFTTNTTADFLVWGAQLNQGPLQPYYSTTPKNLLGYTQEFDNAAWSKLAAGTGVAPVVTANAATAPDGTATADLIVFDRGAGTSGSDISYITFSLVAFTGTAVSSVWLKTSDGSTKQVQLRCGAPAGTPITVTGTWQRFSVTSTNATIDRFQLLLYGNDPNQIASLHVWGAQLSNSASVDPYVYNPGAAPTSAAYYGPRFDYDPVSRAPKGLLIEEQRTNLLTYSAAFSDASWSKLNSSITADAIVAPDGTLTGDKLVENTSTASHGVQSSIISYTSGQTLTLSVYAKAAERSVVTLRIDGNTGNFGNGVYFDLSTGTVSQSATGVTTSIAPVGNGWYRLTATATASGTSSGSSSSIIYLSDTTTGTSGQKSYTGDGTSGIFIWGAQLEAGSFATSYIPTVASQVTRSADNASMIGDNFANWYNATEGTFFTEYGIFSIAAGILGDGSVPSALMYSSNRDVKTFNGTSDATTSNQTPLNTPAKGALSYATNTRNVVLNAGTLASTTGNLQVVSSLQIGLAFGSTRLNGHMRRVMYYNTRLTNAQLQTLTS